MLILKTADTRIDDVCEAVWRQLLLQASFDGAAQNNQVVGRDARVGEVVKELMRRYFPSEAAPLGKYHVHIWDSADDDQISSFPLCMPRLVVSGDLQGGQLKLC